MESPLESGVTQENGMYWVCRCSSAVCNGWMPQLIPYYYNDEWVWIMFQCLWAVVWCFLLDGFDTSCTPSAPHSFRSCCGCQVAPGGPSRAIKLHWLQMSDSWWIRNTTKVCFWCPRALNTPLAVWLRGKHSKFFYHLVLDANDFEGKYCWLFWTMWCYKVLLLYGIKLLLCCFLFLFRFVCNGGQRN